MDFETIIADITAFFESLTSGEFDIMDMINGIIATVTELFAA